MDKKFLIPLTVSVVLHIVLVAVLFVGDFTTEAKPKKNTAVAQEVKPIQATVIDSAKLQKAINKIKKQKADDKAAERKRLQNIEKRANDAKKRRTKEEARIKKLEKQRKKKEQEKKRSDKAAKDSAAKAAKAEKLRKQKEQEKQKAEDAAAQARTKRLKAEAAAKKADDLRKKKIAERKRQEKAAAEQAVLDKQLADQMAAEMATRNKARQQQMMSEVQRYAVLIKGVIEQNMINDRSTMEGRSCKLLISLAPSGFVTRASVVDGDAAVCEAAKRAVYKAGTLPVSKDPEVFKEMRKISVTVLPEF
ncbi:cell envelope integrity protein TolA [Candidatus Colwellia aromaticivorans]|uniref:cell envelope integrity protein TolA n=1 Tax=Candidatus Colwellia aromaticivorans TaxID=2267621 RepID=UPI000DF31DAC|nr:cell envelope integrity protein TolA [Candidatus Colwellia aromaticivorans]